MKFFKDRDCIGGLRALINFGFPFLPNHPFLFLLFTNFTYHIELLFSFRYKWVDVNAFIFSSVDKGSRDNSSKNIFYRRIKNIIFPRPNKNNWFSFIVTWISVIVLCFAPLWQNYNENVAVTQFHLLLPIHPNLNKIDTLDKYDIVFPWECPHKKEEDDKIIINCIPLTYL